MSRPRRPETVLARRDEARERRRAERREQVRRSRTAERKAPPPRRENAAVPRRAAPAVPVRSAPRASLHKPSGRAPARPLPDRAPRRAEEPSARPPVPRSLSRAEPSPRMPPREVLRAAPALRRPRETTPREAAPRPLAERVRERVRVPQVERSPALPARERLGRGRPVIAARLDRARPPVPPARLARRAQQAPNRPAAADIRPPLPARDAPVRHRPAGPPRARVVVPLRRPSAQPRSRSRSAAEPSGLAWLAIRGGALSDSSGSPVRLVGLHGELSDPQAVLADLQALFEPVPSGQRCISVPLRLVAQLEPVALAALDRRIAEHAVAGAYTLLRIEARLWMHGHHLRLARRYAQEPAVLFALLGRAPLAERLWVASRALRAVHPTGIVWLPLESARTAFSTGVDAEVGLLWDAARPQAPRPLGLSGSLRAPVLLDGWQPNERHPLADERLMRLCRDGSIGWLARSSAPLTIVVRGVTVLGRPARALQRAVHLSADGALGLA